MMMMRFINAESTRDPWKGRDCAEHSDDFRESVPTIEKIEKIEVHQLQFSCQMADVQSSRNDECSQFRSGEHQ